MVGASTGVSRFPGEAGRPVAHVSSSTETAQTVAVAAGLLVRLCHRRGRRRAPVIFPSWPFAEPRFEHQLGASVRNEMTVNEPWSSVTKPLPSASTRTPVTAVEFDVLKAERELPSIPSETTSAAPSDGVIAT